ncbi:hypothetical protein EI427_17340 [Flammeovirga pectinis]|uniref:Uncharacterized protein n=1 Tax=Flammeovirga pectinis TaxID=2494373 RepID=A0A3Q9FNM2_9BACT|nr:hypothetical protein [Flammeovirga pectinis]AZQ63925.1 hypothetical protein EI427_17340 [Flammeovirga pectinis]
MSIQKKEVGNLVTIDINLNNFNYMLIFSLLFLVITLPFYVNNFKVNGFLLLPFYIVLYVIMIYNLWLFAGSEKLIISDKLIIYTRKLFFIEYSTTMFKSDNINIKKLKLPRIQPIYNKRVITYFNYLDFNQRKLFNFYGFGISIKSDRKRIDIGRQLFNYEVEHIYDVLKSKGY